MLCRQHHVQYDIKNRGINNFEESYHDTEVSANEVEEVVRVEENVMLDNLNSKAEKAHDKHNKSKVKNEIIGKLLDRGINKTNCSFAKFTNEKWQFDIIENKLDKDYFFIFYNGLDYTFDVGKIDKFDITKIKSNLKIKTSKGRNDEKSFKVLFNGTNYYDVKSKHIFKIVYSSMLGIQPK